jgi:hypothetical protein
LSTPDRPVTIQGANGPLAIGDRVFVENAEHNGRGEIDAIDLDAGKVWVHFEPTGRGLSYIFWVHAGRASKV